ncbi:HupE/UreJ family protein [Elioraea rosea]|uniref:HupE/UreJ family protein n=1 Tax=Elioraea rosea TaxID=2492390 RepID=UPI0038D0247F
MPSTFGEGFLSGLGHPVIGIDHLAFVVAAGLAAAVFGLPLWLPALFVAGSFGGVLLHVAGFDLPLVELAIALSVLGLGGMLAFGRRLLPVAAWGVAFVAAGAFHGHAYGEAVVGAEASAIGAYLVGLALVQAAIAVGAALVARKAHWRADALAPRLAGAATCAVGLVALAGMV